MRSSIDILKYFCNQEKRSETRIKKKMRRVLVTGGCGFIGSHLVERLIEEGCQVTVLDNLSSGKIENLHSVIKSPLLSFHQVDLAIDDIQPYFKGVQWIFHLAALADIVPSIQKPLDYHRSNVDGTVAVLEAARKESNGLEKIVFAASSTCYGIPNHYPTSETAPIRPMYPYAHTKYVAEQYILHWNQVYQLPAISLRFFNVYGPRVRTFGTYGAVFGVFMAQKLARKPFTVVGDGKQTRDFTFVTDVADAMITAVKSDLKREVFNVGSGNTYSINRLVGLLKGDVVYVPKRPGEPDCTFADIQKIQRVLGWKPRVSFEEGVSMMLSRIEEWRSAPLWDEKSIAEATQDWMKHLQKQGAAKAL